MGTSDSFYESRSEKDCCGQSVEKKRYHAAFTLICIHRERIAMAIKKTDNTPQNVLKQTTQMRMWVIIGGISALISVICKVLSSGYLEPFDFGQAALGVVCLGYAISLSKKSSNYAIRINSKITEEV
ncbi:hypothetical protein ACVV4I_12310 [Escherichia coli]